MRFAFSKVEVLPIKTKRVVSMLILLCSHSFVVNQWHIAFLVFSLLEVLATGSRTIYTRYGITKKRVEIQPISSSTGDASFVQATLRSVQQYYNRWVGSIPLQLHNNSDVVQDGSIEQSCFGR